MATALQDGTNAQAGETAVNDWVKPGCFPASGNELQVNVEEVKQLGGLPMVINCDSCAGDGRTGQKTLLLPIAVPWKWTVDKNNQGVQKMDEMPEVR